VITSHTEALRGPDLIAREDRLEWDRYREKRRKILKFYKG